MILIYTCRLLNYSYLLVISRLDSEGLQTILLYFFFIYHGDNFLTLPTITRMNVIFKHVMTNFQYNILVLKPTTVNFNV